MPEITKEDKTVLRKLNILYQISKYVSSTLDIDKVLKIILTGVTFGNGFGFNRAHLFLADRSNEHLVGRMAVGPDSKQDSVKIWEGIKEKDYSLDAFLKSQVKNKGIHSQIDKKIKDIKIPLSTGKLASRSYRDNKIENVDLGSPQYKEEDIEKELIEYIGYPRFCIIPLSSFKRPAGILIVDNKYNQRIIDEEDITFLYMLSQQATLAIENANAYQDLKRIIKRLVQVNEKINYLKEYNENIVENIPVGICVVNVESIIRACNSYFCRMVDRGKGSLLGSNIARHGIEIKGVNIKRYIKKALNKGKSRIFEKENCRFGPGEEKICNVNLSILKNAKNGIDGVIIILDDITEKTKLEKNLEDLKKLAQLGELAAQVSHEIRNPLVAIGGYARRAKKKLLAGEEVKVKNLSIIAEEAQRLESILDNTLHFSRKRKISFKRINLVNVLKDVMSVIEAYAEKNEVKLNMVNRSGIGERVIIRGSASHLKQAFINLIKNSIEASYRGDAVNIYLERKGNDKIIIKIENRGSIIEKEDIEKIFLPFYSRKKTGTGLGLAITKSIISDHNGKIDARSENDITVFIIKLPLEVRVR